MINKTNLIKDNRHAEDDSAEFSIQIIPETPGTQIDYEYEVGLKPLMDYLAKPSESDQEILYFMAGTGVFRVQEF